jgi:hypothetical protein
VIIGIQPIGWTNDDFPEIGNNVGSQSILDKTEQENYVGGPSCIALLVVGCQSPQQSRSEVCE